MDMEYNSEKDDLVMLKGRKRQYIAFNLVSFWQKLTKHFIQEKQL